jgi:hypothetical protein
MQKRITIGNEKNKREITLPWLEVKVAILRRKHIP